TRSKRDWSSDVCSSDLVPRPPFAVERAQLSADELARWPAVPRLVVGAYVEVTGTFALESSHHERNVDGLVIFESIDTAKSSPPRSEERRVGKERKTRVS